MNSIRKETRTIKFRGKRDNGEWVYGSYIADMGAIKSGSKTFPVDAETVGQFTELHDKNGVEIYDGDIIDYDFRGLYGSGETTRHEVYWHREDARFRMFPAIPAFFCDHNTPRMTIVGNVYDNNPSKI